MNSKILIAYVSKSGSTAEIAQAIGETLTSKGANVEVAPLQDVKTLNGYETVVLGSCVRFGGWLPEAVKFVEAHRDELKQVPTAFFTVHILNTGDDENSKSARRAYLDPVRKIVSPNKEAFFAGVGDLKKVSFFEGLIGKLVKSPEGDFRNWQAIRDWAQTLL